MRRWLALLSVLAALPFLSGCLWSGYGAGRGSSDHQTYRGATGEALEQSFGPGAVGDVRIVVRANGRAYRVEAPSGAPTAHYEGPQGPVEPGPC